MSESASAPAPLIDRRRRTIVLWVVLLAFFMDLLDTTIVNVAIPSIQANLGASYSAIQWIIAGYALTFALFLITGGRLGDIFGYRTLFLIGMAASSSLRALSGLAPTTEVLIGARLVQGFTAALMVPQILSTIQVVVPEPRGASGRVGVLRRACGARHCRRSDHRRASDHRQPVGLRLAGDLPRQSAGRRRLPSCSPGSICPVAKSPHPAASRFPRRRAHPRRHDHADVPVDRGA